MFKAFSLACISAVAFGLKINNHHHEENAAAHGKPDVQFDDPRQEKQMMLAQTGSMASNLTCQYGENRNKAAVDDFWSILAGSAQYSDDDFTPDNTSLAWAELGETTTLSASHWKRAKEVFPNQTLFGDGISFDDVRQGGIGNCWFLAAASGLSEVPGRMEKVFLNRDNSLNNNGIYAVNFHTLGLPHTVVVDDFLPLRQSTTGAYSTLYSQMGRDGSLWMAILEKAFAKYHGNYSHLVGGWPADATRTLSGGPYQTFYHSNAAVTADTLWNTMLQFDGSNHIMMAATPGSSDSTTNAEGLVNNHAYTLLGVKQLSNGVRLVKLRNPWGTERYIGDWSDSSPLWTDALRAEAGATVANDGVIHMTIEYYKANVSATDFILDTTNMHSASFLKLNDTNTGNAGAWWCTTTGCQVHFLDIESEVAQDVWVTVHTWDQRMMPSICEDYTTRHVTYGTWDTIGRAWYYGAQALPVATFTGAGKKEMRVEMNFSNDLKAKDWSVVAYGTRGPVKVTHRQGLTSDHMPVAPAKSNPTPTPEPTPNPEPTPDDPCAGPWENWQEQVNSGCNEPTSTEESFLAAMNSLRIVTTKTTCQRKTAEQSYNDPSGAVAYQFYSELYCNQQATALLTTVKMATNQWYELQYTLDDTTEAVKSCTENTDGTTTCVFRLGYYADWEARGLSGPWVKKIGWRTKAGASPTLSKTMAWGS